MKRPDPNRLLTRSDKWYLGGGNRLLWAPPFPIWLEHPGLWDKAHYYNLEIDPVFTWTLLDEDGREILLHVKRRSWTPSGIRRRLAPAGGGRDAKGLAFHERMCCLPEDVLASEISIRNGSSRSRRLHLIIWSAQPTEPGGGSSWVTGAEFVRNKIVFTKHHAAGRSPHFSFACALGLAEPADSHAIRLSEGGRPQPFWSHTPFSETFRGRLDGSTPEAGFDQNGILFIALHKTVTVRPRSELTISAFFSVAPTPAEASSAVHLIAREGSPARLSSDAWEDHWSGIPAFECSDGYLTRAYWYRWYGLRLNTIEAHELNYRHPAVCEGIGYFRAPISYSAPCHIRENRWRHDPALAQGSLRTFLEHQREDGGFRGYIDPHYYRQEMFYHADWGTAIRELARVHDVRDFLAEIYPGMVRYAEYFNRERDPEQSGLYDITNHYETGQEFMSRYVAVNPQADRDNWGEVFRLKGVDVAVYVYALKQTLAWIAATVLNNSSEAQRWIREAESTREEILSRMWSGEEGMFFDLEPGGGTRTGVKALTCFYPYMTDIVSGAHLPGLKRHLFNRKEFLTPFPFPASSCDDPLFSAEGTWKGKRMNCPWNGRVWPMTNSHMAEALAVSAIRCRDAGLRRRAAEFIARSIRMMFFDGDPSRPNSFEHYNPITGSPSAYRGIDDYQHSWIVDLILKYVVGIRPDDERVVIDPFPFPLTWSVADEVMIRGRRWRVERKDKAYRVWRDGREAGRETVGRPLIVSYD